MTTHCVLLELRIANADDFKTIDGKPKWNVPYFEQKMNGSIHNSIYYLTPESNFEEFKTLFETFQIWVFAKPNEAKSTFNCIDWDLVNQELDYELEKLNEIVSKKQGIRSLNN